MDRRHQRDSASTSLRRHPDLIASVIDQLASDLESDLPLTPEYTANRLRNLSAAITGEGK